MKTFEDEYRELAEWFFDELEKINGIKWTGGLDGEHAQKEREIGDLYRRRLRELRKKYGIKG